MRHKLVDETTGKDVKPGTEVTSFRGETYKLVGFESPFRLGSTGRVNVTRANRGAVEFVESFYPQVFNLKIVEIQDDPFDK